MPPILTWPDPRLSEPCAKVTDFAGMEALGRGMLEIMYAAPGRGLAGPQIGVMQRIFVMDVTWKEGAKTPFICINPRIVAASDNKVIGEEACLSIPGVAADVARHDWIQMRWNLPNGDEVTERLEGFAAICAQHEMDHLDGVVIFDRLDAATRDEKLAEYERLA
nr:peptide deformylase [Shimia biformata]